MTLHHTGLRATRPPRTGRSKEAGQSPCCLPARQGPASFLRASHELLHGVSGLSYLWGLTQGDWSPREVGQPSDTSRAVGIRGAEPEPQVPGQGLWGGEGSANLPQNPRDPCAWMPARWRACHPASFSYGSCKPTRKIGRASCRERVSSPV